MRSDTKEFYPPPLDQFERTPERDAILRKLAAAARRAERSGWALAEAATEKGSN